ncbi:hypothetical protein E2C01_004980 [Portunus trituberculatus]|uniref:Uncharacterized protein n=1 Tax=Portunus trituberculatus TaxID=210409 RepID=A0A5B7CVD9_PORTR|nr:hypothetical protein [Portunus trituberculatus]
MAPSGGIDLYLSGVVVWGVMETAWSVVWWWLLPVVVVKLHMLSSSGFLLPPKRPRSLCSIAGGSTSSLRLQT